MEKTIETSVNVSNLMTVPTYALMMGVTKRTVYNWIDDGKIKRVIHLGKKWIDKSTLKS